MARLIRAVALTKRTDRYPPYISDTVRKELRYVPTVDAVEVVRCKDCFYRDGNACDYSAVYVRPNGYCQWGRRKEDETD